MHGNNKSDEELAAAVDARAAYVVLDSVEELERARAAGVERMLIRITPGIEADTHESIRTGHVGSKFGVTPDEAAKLAAARRRPARARRLAAARARRGTRDGRVAEPLPRRERLDAAGRRPRRRARRADGPGRAGAVDRGVRGRARRRARGAGASDPRARTLARRSGRRDAVPRRQRQALRRTDVGRRRRRHLRQRPAAVLRRALHGGRRDADGSSRPPERTASPGSTASRATC